MDELMTILTLPKKLAPLNLLTSERIGPRSTVGMTTGPCLGGHSFKNPLDASHFTLKILKRKETDRWIHQNLFSHLDTQLMQLKHYDGE